MASALYVGLIILSLFAGEYYGNDMFTNTAILMVSIKIFLTFSVFGAWLWFGLADHLHDMSRVEIDRALKYSNISNFMTIGLVLALVMCGMMFASVMVIVSSFMIFWVKDDLKSFLNNA